MSKVLSSEDLTPTINLARCSDGYWLHDTTRGMNLSMRAKTPTEAFIEALTYYQKRLSEVEHAHSQLKARVDQFVAQFAEDES